MKRGDFNYKGIGSPDDETMFENVVRCLAKLGTLQLILATMKLFV